MTAHDTYASTTLTNAAEIKLRMEIEAAREPCDTTDVPTRPIWDCPMCRATTNREICECGMKRMIQIKP